MDELALALFMALVCANNPDNPLPANNLAVFAQFLN
jgi:hypothetical protein